MALIDLLKDSVFGLKGKTPAKRAGASADNDIHVKNGTHNDSHTGLEIKGSPNKYVG
jgi:hypothetical protein